jgi:hypothetical protein
MILRYAPLALSHEVMFHAVLNEMVNKGTVVATQKAPNR